MADSTAFPLGKIPLLFSFHLAHLLPLPSVRSSVNVNFCHVFEATPGGRVVSFVPSF